MDIFRVFLYVKFWNLSKIISYESRGLPLYPCLPSPLPLASIMVIYITILAFRSLRPYSVCPSLSVVRPIPLSSFITFRVLDAQSDCCWVRRIELRILDFKTTWSEFQKASPTVAERGEAELRILDFKTTWSEFQKASQTAAEQGKAKLPILNSKTTWSEFKKPIRPLLSEAKPSYVYSILKPHGQSSKSKFDRCWARRSRAAYTRF